MRQTHCDTSIRPPDRRELVREGAEDGQEPRRRDGGWRDRSARRLHRQRRLRFS